MNRFVPYEFGAPKSVCSESVVDGSISAAFIIFPDVLSQSVDSRQSCAAAGEDEIICIAG